MANALPQLNAELDVLYDKLEQLYRPAKFRSILGVDNSLAPWVANIDIDTVESFAELQLVGPLQTEFPQGTEETTRVSYPVFTWGARIGYTDAELDRAIQLGMGLPTKRAAANSLATEQMLDKIAAVGGATAVGGTPVGGLFTQSSTPVTITGTWSSASATQIVDDLYALIDGVEVEGKDLFEANQIVLPPTAYRTARAKRFTDNATALSQFLSENPQIQNVHRWNHAETAGVASVTRMCAFDDRSDVAVMVIPQELTSFAPERRGLHWLIPQSVVSAGVISEHVEGISYADAV